MAEALRVEERGLGDVARGVDVVRGGGLRGGAELREELFDGEEALDVDEFEQAEFEVEALLLAEAEVVEGAEHDGEEAGELFFGEERRRSGRRGLRSSGEIWRRSAAMPVASASGERPVILATMQLRR